MTLAPTTRTTRGHPLQPRLADGYVEPIFRRWAEQLVGDGGYHLAEDDAGATATFVFDGAGDGALRFLLDRPWSANTRTVVYTLHAHPIWHAALASTGAHQAHWPNSVAGLALTIARAREGEVRTPPIAPVTPAVARVAARLLTGMTDAAVAERLGMSVKTVRSHAAAMMAACFGTTTDRSGRRAATLLEISNCYYTGAER